MSSFPRALQRLALALVVLATALRLSLPWWHDATCRHHHHATAGAVAANASDGAATDCACTGDLDPRQPWWIDAAKHDDGAEDDGPEGGGPEGGGDRVPSHATAFPDATCLACELSHVPPGPPPPPFVVPATGYGSAPAAAHRDAEPLGQAQTTTPPSRAPPQRRVAA